MYPTLYAISPTPFSEDASHVDTEAVTQNVARLASCGIGNILLTGAYGEFQSLSDEERVRLLTAVRAAIPSGNVIACAALPSTDSTLRLGRRLADGGADLVMVSPPLLGELTDSDIMRHFEVLDRHLEAPLAVYNNPVFGVDLSPLQLSKLAALPSARFIKQGTRSIASLIDSISAVHDVQADVSIFGASDTVAHVSLPAGADGLTSTNCWVFPKAFVGVMDAFAEKDWERLIRITSPLRPYFSFTKRHGQPATVKAAMRIRGYAGSAAVRLPLRALNGEELAELREILQVCDEALDKI